SRLRESDLLTGGSYGPGTPAGMTELWVSGGNPLLKPERAETKTAGFVLHPEVLPGFSMELSWFDIDYKDRIVQPILPLSPAFTNPALAQFITLNPTAAQQAAAFAYGNDPTDSHNYTGAPYDPTKVYAIVYDQFTNAAEQQVRGIDVSPSYRADAWGGSL